MTRLLFATLLLLSASQGAFVGRRRWPRQVEVLNGNRAFPFSDDDDTGPLMRSGAPISGSPISTSFPYPGTINTGPTLTSGVTLIGDSSPYVSSSVPVSDSTGYLDSYPSYGVPSSPVYTSSVSYPSFGGSYSSAPLSYSPGYFGGSSLPTTSVTSSGFDDCNGCGTASYGGSYQTSASYPSSYGSLSIGSTGSAGSYPCPSYGRSANYCPPTNNCYTPPPTSRAPCPSMRVCPQVQAAPYCNPCTFAGPAVSSLPCPVQNSMCC